MAITYKTSDFVLNNPDTIHADLEPKSVIPKSRFYEPAKPYWLYALKLEHGKYYVGSTAQKNPYDRIMQHVEQDGGAKWTELHAPIEVMEIRDAGVMARTLAEVYEHNLTGEYMTKYGVNKVRGGIFNSPERLYHFSKNVIIPAYYMYPILSAIFFLLAVIYIMLRHIFNWW